MSHNSQSLEPWSPLSHLQATDKSVFLAVLTACTILDIEEPYKSGHFQGLPETSELLTF